MSKLIITSIENGKISYIEGEEVSTSLESLEGRVEELRNKISLAKSVSSDSLYNKHKAEVDKINFDFEQSFKELESTRLLKIEEADRLYEEELANLVSSEEIEVLEKEEAKLSLILGGLRAQLSNRVEVTPEVAEVVPEVEAEEVEPEVQPVAEEVEEVPVTEEVPEVVESEVSEPESPVEEVVLKPLDVSGVRIASQPNSVSQDSYISSSSPRPVRIIF